MSRLWLCSLVFAACAAPDHGAQTKSNSGRVVAVNDLPAENAAVLAAYGRGGDAWEQKRLEVVADPKLTQFVVDNLIVELAHAHSGLAGAEPERARRAFGRAENELVRFGDKASPALASVLVVGNAVVASLATDVVVRIGPTAVPDVLPLLDDPHLDARRRAAIALQRMPHGLDLEPRVRETLMRRAQSDPEWLIRAECALALGARGQRDTLTEPWRAALETCLKDEDPAVAESAARGLETLGDPRAIPALIQALDRSVRNGDVRVLHSVQRSLGVLSGETEKSDVAAWRDWWFAHRLEIEQGRTFDASSRRKE